MLDPLDRIKAHVSAPDVYDAPNAAELSIVKTEMTMSREFADMLYKSIMGGGETVTFSQSDIDTIAALRGPQLIRLK